MNILKNSSYIAILSLVLIFFGSAYYGRESLQSLSIQFVGEGREHQDKYIVGINSEEKAPDYTLEVRVEEEWQVIGTISNTFSAKEALEFTPQKRIPARLIEEVRLYDQDKIENDILETVPFQKGIFQGENYQFQSTTQLSLMGGVTYFWQTAIGKAILAGITICVVILFLSSGVF